MGISQSKECRSNDQDAEQRRHSDPHRPTRIRTRRRPFHFHPVDLVERLAANAKIAFALDGQAMTWPRSRLRNSPRPKSPPPGHLPEPQLQNNAPRRLRRHVERFRHHTRRHERPRHDQFNQFRQL